MKRFGPPVDLWSGNTCIKKKCHHRIGIKGRVSRPLRNLNKSTTAATDSVAAADSSSSKDAATVLDLSPVNLVKCSTSTADAAATAKTLPVKTTKKKRPKFGAIINLLRLGKKKYNKKKKIKNKKKSTTI
jgi:hypothetical protein